jgi:hypothetical protein
LARCKNLPRESSLAVARSPLTITAAPVADTYVLTVYGMLDSTTYFRLRDAVIKAALDVPRAVIVDVTKLAVRTQSAWMVFPSARWHITPWPDVPIALVCDNAAGHKTLRRNGITRFIPVFWSVDAAVAALPGDDGHRYRRRAKAALPAGNGGILRCRELISQWLTAWSKTDYIPAASAVSTVLVENALAHSGRALSLRLEANSATVAVAVQQASTDGTACQQAADGVPRGLERVGVAARAWGTTPTSPGKTVWVVVGPESRFQHER